MKNFFTIFLLIISLTAAQDRSMIFSSTPDPYETEGFLIEWDGNTGQSISDRIYVSDDMVLEKLKIYAVANSLQSNATVILHSDNEGLPGDEIYSWDIDVAQENHGNNYVYICNTDCNGKTFRHYFFNENGK